MRKRWILPLLLLLLLPLGWAYGQKEVRFGKYRVIPERNIYADGRLRGARGGVLEPSTLAEGKHYLLLQFEALPTPSARAGLAEAGIELQGYCGSDTYMAVVRPGSIGRGTRGAGLIAAFAMRPEWKIAAPIAEDDIPEYALAAGGCIRAVVALSPSVDRGEILAALRALGVSDHRYSEIFHSLSASLTREQAVRIAEYPWVQGVGLAAPPKDYLNRGGRVLSRANLVTLPAEFNGRGLTGRGVKVGVWDGNVERHVDFGNRLHTQEFELPVPHHGLAHGMHVAGTIGASGLIDPQGRGVAPGVELYAYNFDGQSNGLSEAEEMEQARRNFGITLTQNSYGYALSRFCKHYDVLAYNIFGSDWENDLVAAMHPSLTHVFAAGNDKGSCDHHYGSNTKRMKNAIYVGAVDALGGMADFSSWGPMDDGRLLPTVCAKGVDVLSTVKNNDYDLSDGTSMACPNVTGVLALVSERYRQLNRGAEPISSLLRALLANTAEDLGNTGPDYQFGYGLINAERAVQAVENGWYAVGSLAQGEASLEFPIEVPAGVSPRALRVMVAWTDTVGLRDMAYGARALVNDLDLSLMQNGQATLPWVLNAKEPGAVATQGVDTVNNMEQVTVLNPSGRYVARVSPRAIASVRQQFAVVYWFEQGGLRLTYPNGHEQLQPGETINVCWENSVEPVTIELSQDGGKHFKTLLSHAPGHAARIVIPEDLAPTGQALIRVVEGESIDMSDAPFVIMQAPADVTLTEPVCDLSGLRLSWSSVEGAAGYQVLRANVAAGTFSVVEDNLTDTECAIQEAWVLDGERNIFAVRARLDDGTLGRRSRGQLVKAKAHLKLTPAQMPFVEHFLEYPSPLLSMEKGENMLSEFSEQTPGMGAEPGAHLLGMTPFSNADAWDPEHPFQLEANTVKLRICTLDLTDIPRDAHPTLRLKFLLEYGEEPTDSQFQVLVNGDVLPDLGGRASIMALTKNTDPYRYAAYDLSALAGAQGSVELVYAGRNSAVDKMLLAEVRIERRQQGVDLRLLGVKAAPSQANIDGEHPISVILENNSPETLENVPLGYRINGGKWVYGAVQMLKPYELIFYTFVERGDFTTTKTYGERFSVEVEAFYPEDIAPENNTRSMVVTHYGHMYLMPRTQRGSLMGMPSVTDPMERKVVQGSLLFADQGGKLEGYPNGEETTLRFEPSRPGRFIHLTFREFETEKHFDELAIYTHLQDNFPTPQDVPTAKLSGNLTGQDLTFYSTAPDGAIVVKFTSDPYDSKAGWLAEVREMPRPNLFSLRLEDFAPYLEDGQHPVRITLQNNTPLAMERVKVAYRLDRGDWVEGEIARVEANGSVGYEFSKKADLSRGGYHTIEAEIRSEDLDGHDNRVERRVVNDRYCRGAVVKAPKELRIASLRLVEASLQCLTSDSLMAYHLNTDLKLYSQYPAINTLHAQLNRGLTSDYALGLWVDWNGDAQFEDSERISCPLDESETHYSLPIAVPAQASTGKYRARIMVGLRDGMTACPSAALQLGDIKDFTLELVDTPYPVENDLGVVSLTVKSGVKLSAAEPVSVKVQNRTPNPVSQFRISYSINGQTPVTEDAVLTIAPFGEVNYTFAQQADLSAMGRYEIKAFVEPDARRENDALTVQAYCVAPEADGFYALEFLGDAATPESLELGTVGDLSFDRVFTVECWVNPGNASFQRIVEGKGLLIALVNDPVKYGTPGHRLLVKINDKYYIYSDDPVITPGVWQHIAVVVDADPPSHPAVSLFLNGSELFTTHNDKIDTYISNSERESLRVGHGLQGQIDMLRIWSANRSDEIEGALYTRFTGSDPLPDDLVVEYCFDEGPGNAATLFGSQLASIVSQRTEAGENCLWVQPKRLVHAVKFTGETHPALRTEDAGVSTFTVTLPKAMEVKLSTLTGADLQGVWPTTEFYYNGVLVDGDTQFDLSAGPISVEARVSGLFGSTRVFSEIVKVKVELEPSAECDILSLQLKSAKNPGLAADIRVDDPASLLELDLAGITDPTRVSLNLSLSGGAKAYYAGQPFKDDETFVDFTRPVLLTVLAADGHTTRIYTVRPLRASQTVNFSLAKTDYRFGDAPVNVTASASSALPISFISSDGNVVSVVNGALHIAGVGEASVWAVQEGNRFWAPAESAKVMVRVEPCDLTVVPRAITLEYGEAFPALGFEYKGILSPEDSLSISVPEYHVYTSASAQWDPAQGPLPEGQHTLRPATEDLGVMGNYNVKALDGKVEVSRVSTHTVGFTVLLDGKPEPGVSIRISSFMRATDAQGKVNLALLPGRYPYSVQHPGYASVADTVDISSADVDLTIPLARLEFTLTYSSAGNGAILGESVQHVEKGGSGDPVAAAPLFGYSFERWDDGLVENPRQDRDVQKSSAVKAHFVKVLRTVRYGAGFGGVIEGNLEQSLELGGNTTPVTAKPKSPDFAFYAWSDGSTENPRSEVNVLKDLSLTASFIPVKSSFSLPFYEDFEQWERTPNGWTNTTSAKGGLWDFSNPPSMCLGKIYTAGSGVQANINANERGGKQINAWLITPMLSLKNVIPGSKLRVSYSTMYKLLFAPTSYFKLKFRAFKEGSPLSVDWEDIYTHPEEIRPARTISVDVTIPSGADQVQFAWEYNGKDELMVVLDDISITASTTDYHLSYIAGEGGTVNGQGKVDQTVPMGQKGEPVKVEAAEGWHFVGWSDGSLTNPRVDDRPLFIYAKFSQTPAQGPAFFSLIYRTGGFGHVEGFAWQPEVSKGGDGIPVHAVADAGYRFDGWSDGVMDNPRVDRDVKRPVDVTAKFILASHCSVSFAQTEGGKLLVTLNGEPLASGASVPIGSVIVISAHPYGGYRPAELTVNGQGFTSGQSLTLKESVTIGARFERATPVEVEAFSLSVMPNPFSAVLFVQSSQVVKRYTVLSLEGLTVAEGWVNAETFSVDLSSLPSGVYLLRCEGADGARVVRMLKE